MKNYDYLTVGSNGFAQVDDPMYQPKNNVEMRVLLDHVLKHCPIPESFVFLDCRFAVKSFPHDFGTYHEIVMYYNRALLEELEDSEDTKDEILYNAFWNFFNRVEMLDLEAEELTELIRDEYLKTIDVKKAEHLNVA